MVMIVEDNYPKIKADKIKYIDLSSITLSGDLDEEEIIAYKLFFKSRPEHRHRYVEIPLSQFSPVGCNPY
jgi:hypothetical protein